MSLLQAGLSRRSPVVAPTAFPAPTHRVQRGPARPVRSTRGAVLAFGPVRFPEPPPEPAVRLVDAAGSPQAPLRAWWVLILGSARVRGCRSRRDTGSAWCAPWRG